MGKELMEEFPSFRRTIQELDAVLRALPEAPESTLEQALLEPKETSQMNHVARSQPLCTAIQIALVKLLAQWGICPEAVVGQSSGEICAAYVSGRLSASQAITVAYYRGYAVGQAEVTAPGAMMAVDLEASAAKEGFSGLEMSERIRVACVNSPESVTISGDEEAIDGLRAHLEASRTFARKLNTDGRVYHSHHMLPIGNTYQDLLEKSPDAPTVPDASAPVWYSSVYAEPISDEIMPDYWRKNLESPVLFSDAVTKMVKATKHHMVEIGLHSAMEMPIKQTMQKVKVGDAKQHYSTALARNKNGVHCVLNLMGSLYMHGHNVAFDKVNYVETLASTGKQGKVLTDLPGYPWTYDGIVYKVSRSANELRNRKHGHHDLVGLEMNGGNRLERTWRNTIKVKDLPWFESHKLGQEVVFPAAAYVAMAIEPLAQISSQQKSDKPTFALRHMKIVKALQLSTDKNAAGVEMFTFVSSTKLSGTARLSRWFDFEITSYDNEVTSLHASGMISLISAATILPSHNLAGNVSFLEVAK